MAIVYQHRKPGHLEPFYIGISKTNKRAYSKKDRNPHWQNIVNKYGYEVEITHEDIIYEEACAIEKYLIAFWGRKDLGQGPLVNLTDGGEGTNNPSEETRKKIGASNSGEKNGMYGKGYLQSGNKSPMWGRTGEKHPFFGKKHSAKTKNKWSVDRTGKYTSENNPFFGKKHSKETRQKLSAAKTGKHHSEETKQKMSAAMSREKHPMFGKHHSEKTKQKQREATGGKNSPRAKTVVIEYHSGEIKKLPTRNAAADYLKISGSYLSNILAGRVKLSNNLKKQNLIRIYYEHL